jgi:hypothetical protein
MATYHIQSEDIQESAGWLKQNMQTLLDGMTQAKSKIDSLIQGGYNTPQAQTHARKRPRVLPWPSLFAGHFPFLAPALEPSGATVNQVLPAPCPVV